MTEPAWWGREAGGRGEARTVPGPGPSGVQPELVDATREAAREAVRDRIARAYDASRAYLESEL